MTKDAEALLCICYHDYLERVKSGQSKTESRYFSEDYIHETDSLSSWHEDDFHSTCSELQHLHYFKVWVTGSFELTSDAIEYMENRFKNNVKELAQFLSLIHI